MMEDIVEFLGLLFIGFNMKEFYKDFSAKFIGSNCKPKRISEVDLYVYVHLVSRKNNINVIDFVKYLVCKSLESIQPSKEKSTLILKLDKTLRRIANEQS